MDKNDFVYNFLNDRSVLYGRILHPRSSPIPKESKELRVLKFPVEKGVELGGILYLHENPSDHPTIMHFHGNGEVALDYINIASLFNQIGVNLAVFDFREYGFSTGKISYTFLLKDPIPLYLEFHEWMQDEYPGKSAEQFILMGRSLGSACASALGAYEEAHAIKKIVFESGYSDTYELMTDLFELHHPQLTKESLKPYSNHTFQEKIGKPTLILHGVRDNLIPINQAQHIFDSIPKNIQKKFIRINRASHNDIMMFGNEYFGPLRDFIQDDLS